MKKSLSVGLTTLLILVLGAAVAVASHTVTFSFDGTDHDGVNDVEVTAGESVTINLRTSDIDHGNNLKINWCELKDEVYEDDEPTGEFEFNGVPTEAADCLAGDDDYAEWNEKAKAATSSGSLTEDNVSFVLDTSLEILSGVEKIGFMGEHVPAGSAHPDGRKVVDVVIVAPTVSGDHPGCQGVENAISQIESRMPEKAKGKSNSLAALDSFVEKWCND